MAQGPRTKFTIERLDENRGHCDCCGQTSRSVAGLVYAAGDAYAAYWMHWTAAHLADTGANLDLVLGKWGEGTGPADRVAIALVHRQQPDGTPALMVIDAQGRPAATGNLAATGLRREDVIGTPLAQQVFSLTDAIYEQDGRFF
jgi:hypothetical protein